MQSRKCSPSQSGIIALMKLRIIFFAVTISRDSLCSQKISREIAKLQNQSAIPKTILPNGPGFSKLPSMVRQTALFVAMLQ